MFTKKLYLTLILLGCQFASPVYAEIYKCKTTNGETIYSSKKCADDTGLFTLQADLRPLQTKNIAISEKEQAMPSVDIYITSWCPYCKKAMAYLRSKNIDFNVYDIEKDAQANAKKQILAPRYSGVPLTVINGKVIKGFSKDRFEQALK